MKKSVKIIIFTTGFVFLTGCTNREESINKPTITENFFMEQSENSETETGALQISEMPKNHLSNAGIEFDYPSDLKIMETRGEDGCKNEFTTENGELIFWYEQGENWRVDMDWDQDSYQKILENRYPDAIIDEYTKTTINDIEMLNIIFHQSDQNVDDKIEEYIFVGKYAFYDFYFINGEADWINELIKSVHLITD